MPEDEVDRRGSAITVAALVASRAGAQACRSREETEQAKGALAAIKAEADRLLALPLYPWQPMLRGRSPSP